jgi:hypothetical protein
MLGYSHANTSFDVFLIYFNQNNILRKFCTIIQLHNENHSDSFACPVINLGAYDEFKFC